MAEIISISRLSQFQRKSVALTGDFPDQVRRHLLGVVRHFVDCSGRDRGGYSSICSELFPQLRRQHESRIPECVLYEPIRMPQQRWAALCQVRLGVTSEAVTVVAEGCVDSHSLVDVLSLVIKEDVVDAWMRQMPERLKLPR